MLAIIIFCYLQQLRDVPVS